MKSPRRRDPSVALASAARSIQRGELAAAERLVASVLAGSPGHGDALNLMGVVRLQQGDPTRAVECLQRAVRSRPEAHPWRENLAEALRRAGQPEESRAQAEHLLRLAPERPAAWALLGRLSLDASDLGGAAQMFSRALQRAPQDVDVLLSLMVVCNRSGEFELARRYGGVASRLRPEDPRVWTNIGQAYRAEHRFELAVEAFERAGEFAPARFNLGFVRMHQRDLAGLELLEARKELLGLGLGVGIPEWTGQPMPDSTLLVLHEQGLGDTLLMSQFYERLTSRVGQVVFCVQQSLLPLLQAEFPDLRLVDSPHGVVADAWVATMSLPHRLGVRSFDEVGGQPWLLRTRAAHPPTGSRPRVGLNWAGNPKYAYDAIRSTHLATFAPLLAIEDVEWVSLHRGHLESEAAALGLPQPLAHAKDFLDTAVVVSQCDLVISTETAIPNLSAAMGVPTAVLTSPDFDWRWRDWYPGARLCPQLVTGDWSGALAGALEAVAETLRRHTIAAGRGTLAA